MIGRAGGWGYLELPDFERGEVVPILSDEGVEGKALCILIKVSFAIVHA